MILKVQKISMVSLLVSRAQMTKVTRKETLRAQMTQSRVRRAMKYAEKSWISWMKFKSKRLILFHPSWHKI